MVCDNNLAPFHVIADTLCEQLISPCYDNTQPGSNGPDGPFEQPYLELAYAVMKRANALEQLRVKGSQFLAHQVGQDVASLFKVKCVRDQIKLLIERNHKALRPHFWSNAVHAWRPTFGNHDKTDKTKEACIGAHISLPGFYICGEALSTTQGWSLGALQTATIVVKAAMSFFQARTMTPLPPALPYFPKEYVIYDKRSWM